MIATIEFPNFKLKYTLNFKFIYSDWGFSQLSAAVAKQWLKKIPAVKFIPINTKSWIQR